MRFLADEGVDRGIVNGLRKVGFDVFFIVEHERSIDDETILELARSEKRILITRDKDFGELVFRLNKAHSGVILIRLEGYDTKERSEMVCKLISRYQEQLINSFAVIQKGVIRIR